jgi:hypothetical protein
MDTKNVNMHYRFTSDSEPTDEQLAVIMQEVGEDVRRQSKENARKLLERIEQGFQQAQEYDAAQRQSR